jgi:hypothetical protein
LGSFFAGVKAGTISGVLYIGGIAVFNAVLLLGLKTSVLNAITQTYSQVCTVAPQVNGSITPNDCYSLLLSVDVPYIAFIGFLITILLMGLFGMFYDNFPWNSPLIKGEAIAWVVLLCLLVFGYYGFSFDYTSGLATGVFLLLWTPIFGYTAGKLYVRYTRVITFEEGSGIRGKILVDGRNVSGKTRTYALRSTHGVKAEVSEGTFKAWAVSGGVRIEDSRSFDTTMEVEGDGVIRMQCS